MAESGADKRAWARLNMYLPVRVCPRDTEHGESEESTFTINISSGGVFFLSRKLYAPGTPLRMAITVPPDGRCRPNPLTVNCTAEVVRIERFRINSSRRKGGEFGVAARFREGFRMPMEELSGALPRAERESGSGSRGKAERVQS